MIALMLKISMVIKDLQTYLGFSKRRLKMACLDVCRKCEHYKTNYLDLKPYWSWVCMKRQSIWMNRRSKLPNDCPFETEQIVCQTKNITFLHVWYDFLKFLILLPYIHHKVSYACFDVKQAREVVLVTNLSVLFIVLANNVMQDFKIINLIITTVTISAIYLLPIIFFRFNHKMMKKEL